MRSVGAMRKRCPKCELTKDIDEFDPHAGRADGRQSECRECMGRRSAEWVKRNREQANARQVAYRARLFAQVVAAYGGRCSCCGEDDPVFLTLDHVDGREPNELAGSYLLYARAKREGWPAKYRLLCWNCNCGRERNGGVCPHEERRLKLVTHD
jgi:hypothetical protein